MDYINDVRPGPQRYNVRAFSAVILYLIVLY